MEINHKMDKSFFIAFLRKAGAMVFDKMIMNICLLIMISFFGWHCQNEANINIRTIKIVSNPSYRDIKILAPNGDVLYEQLRLDQVSPKETLLARSKNSNDLLSNVIDKSNLDSLRSKLISRINYYGIENISSDFAKNQDVDSLLQRLNIRNFIDFRTQDGQILRKLIVSMEFGNPDSISNNGFKLYTFPSMDLIHRDENFTYEMLDSLGAKVTQGLFSIESLAELVRDEILMEQFRVLANKNGNILLALIDLSNENLIRKVCYLYYQYIDLDSGFLRIGKVYINPYRYFPKYYE